MKIKDIIYSCLYKRLEKKQREIVQLQWQKLELEQSLNNLKKNQEENKHDSSRKIKEN